MKKKLVLSILMLTIVFQLFADNPLVTHIYTADPTARVFNNKLYIYPSHDINEHDGLSGANGFMMEDYHVFSSTDLINYTDHGVILDQKDVNWVDNNSFAMWAPDCIEKNGTYYFYFPGNFKIGVATANDPAGPYTVRQTPISNTDGMIDPNIFIDDDGTPYMYMGGGTDLKVMRMKSDMITPDMSPITVTSLPSQYKEGSFVFKRNGTYYFTYPIDLSGGEEIAYATGNSPLGPFTVRGTIMDRWTDCWTNHHSIVEYKNQWYFFYHHQDISGDATLRSMCAEKLFFNTDGTIQKITATRRGIGVCSAYQEIQIDRYNSISSSGAQVHAVDGGEPTGWMVDYIENNGWIKYNDVDFGSSAQTQISARVSSGASGGTIEARLGSSTGTLVGSIAVPSTGGWQNWQTVTSTINGSATGQKNLVLVFKGGSGNLFNVNWVKFSSGGSVSQGPYGGSARTIPGTIEAEDYDIGGAGVAYYDATSGNEGGAYRSDDVDIESRDGGNNIGWAADGEWLEYTVDATSGTYSIEARVAATSAGKTLNLTLDGSNLGSITVPNTGDWGTFQTVSINNISITGGTNKVLRLTMNGGGMNLNWIKFTSGGTTPSQSPYGGTAWSIPGKIESENYDNGGEGIAYHDVDATNNGGAGRTVEGVDVQTCGEGGLNIGWTSDNEWMEYTVNVATAGNYDLNIRYASLNATGKINVTIGSTTANNISLPATNGWQSYQTITQALTLNAGEQVVRIDVVTSGINLNYIEFTSGTSTPVNLLLNNGFETGDLTSWGSWGSVSAVNNNAHSGSSAVYVNGSGAAEQTVTVRANTTYTLSAWGKVSASGQTVNLGAKDFGGSETSVQVNSTSYQQKSLTFTTGSSNSSAKIYFYAANAAYQVYGDDFELVEGTKSAASDEFELKNKASFSVFPMPISGEEFFVSLDNYKGELVEVSFLDIQGRTIYQETTSSENMIIESDIFMNSGIYFIRVASSIDIQVQKLVVNK